MFVGSQERDQGTAMETTIRLENHQLEALDPPFLPKCPVLLFNKAAKQAPCSIDEVESIHLELSAGGRRFVYKLKGRSDILVTENELQYAPRCPVWLQKNKNEPKIEASIMRISFHHQKEVVYRVKVDDLVVENALHNQLKFRVIDEPELKAENQYLKFQKSEQNQSRLAASNNGATETPPLVDPAKMGLCSGYIRIPAWINVEDAKGTNMNSGWMWTSFPTS